MKAFTDTTALNHNDDKNKWVQKRNERFETIEVNGHIHEISEMIAEETCNYYTFEVLRQILNEFETLAGTIKDFKYIKGQKKLKYLMYLDNQLSNTVIVSSYTCSTTERRLVKFKVQQIKENVMFSEQIDYYSDSVLYSDFHYLPISPPLLSRAPFSPFSSFT